MVTLIKGNKLRLGREDNLKILEELQIDKSSNINPDLRMFLKSCIDVSTKVSKNKTQRVF